MSIFFDTYLCLKKTKILVSVLVKLSMYNKRIAFLRKRTRLDPYLTPHVKIYPRAVESLSD